MADDRYYTNFIERGVPASVRKGHVTLAECGVCGYLDWISTRGADPDGYSIEPMEQCPKCMDAFHRAPELVRWVMGVVGTAKRNAGVRGVSRDEQPTGNEGGE